MRLKQPHFQIPTAGVGLFLTFDSLQVLIVCRRTEKVKIKNKTCAYEASGAGNAQIMHTSCNKQDAVHVFFPSGAVTTCYQCFGVLAFIFFRKTFTVCVSSCVFHFALKKAAHSLTFEVQRQRRGLNKYLL